MEKMNNNKGFTLIEAIVTVVLIAIIAAVATPVYNGYINDSKQDAVTNLAETTALAANSWVRKRDEDSLTLNALNLRYNQCVYTITIDKNNDEITVQGHGKAQTVNY